MYNVLKALTVGVAALLVMEIAAATYVSSAQTAPITKAASIEHIAGGKTDRLPKIARTGECFKQSFETGLFLPCSLLMKYDKQMWLDSGQEI